MKIGLDVGSTTIKSIVLDDEDQIVFQSYERHYSQITEKMTELLTKIRKEVVCGKDAKLTVSGSAGMGVSETCGLPFVQEVYATRIATGRLLPETDCIIELGGEDAKILFLTGGTEVRMNGSCAGGTGAFIDQMATLLGISLEEMDKLSAQYEKIYTIASRCGVFAKSDIQPLLNQGARKSDLSASIFAAVANQTIAGLAQGRPITGNVVYLGGPLTFLSGLRHAFDTALKTTGTCPENSLYYVALGAAFSSEIEIDLDTALKNIASYGNTGNFRSIAPLFQDQAAYDAFVERHSRCKAPRGDFKTYKGPVFLGVDSGSTTIKAVVMGSDGQILDSIYRSNAGNPVPLVRDYLLELYKVRPDLRFTAAAVTGYGEELLKNAFNLDFGIVETIAHFTAAKRFMPKVDFVIDIGGQDMKCFKIRGGAIDNIFLNEACSSGCGSFLQTFANTLGYSIEDFAKLGLFAKHPVDLGSRCTVFMNSQVKQAQKDGATTADISAGLSVSVVKNALYKVIRVSSAEELGRNIVVQGGTFLNDAVLRVFEKEMHVDVVRPDISGLMGAYGAAVYAMQKSLRREEGSSTLISKEELENFKHEVKVTNCGLCNNNCRLTINIFAGGRRFIGGNRCERPVTKRGNGGADLDLFAYKLSKLQSYVPVPAGSRGKIGIPMCLNMYELLPFWHTFFSLLGFEVVTSPLSTRELYIEGQSTIPSDTVCFPAKLAHGHIMKLLDAGLKTIFYPCMSYNIDEHRSDNHYNCPVVAYYPEVLAANMPQLKNVNFIDDYVGIHRPRSFPKKMTEILNTRFDGTFTLKEVKIAAGAAYKAYEAYMQDICAKGNEMIDRARLEHRQIIVLSGRPYHLDPEVNHGIDKLITTLGAAVVSEDVIAERTKKQPVDVLNQWTYHARLYSAAEYVATQADMNLVQMVSFGCGLDAITTDEVRSILEKHDKIYTQIKIDEITNLGAVKIRLRSLFAALEQ
ncbi:MULTISPECIES: acyl-CoA dehydratase activase-related protein [Caproicibacterium]|uniref:Acyl-CoA dehydratase activase-related protein n=1 Tax=Caproicibacterium argilliputei TaxID=3030016 RepID=A0AA97D8F9_9FIRM|nr:acyl-CoA dehydratase activase-related protein [Caproicibacterium argilliputei]WOC31587.1 acyl-CoA dehydratase activase-related protein [Caproicibacterium argilliputei]